MKNQHFWILIVLFVIILSPLTALAADGPTQPSELFDLNPTVLSAQSPGNISSIAPMQAPDCPTPVVVYTQVWSDKNRVVAEFGGRFVAVTDWGDMASSWGPTVACNGDVVLIAHHEATPSGQTVIIADLFDLYGKKLQGPVEFPNSKNSIQNPRCSTNGDSFTCVYTDFSKGRYGQRFLSVEINSTGVSMPEPIAPTAQFQVYSSIGCSSGTCIVAGAIHDTTNIYIRRESGSWVFIGSMDGQLPTVSINASTREALVMTNVTNVTPNRLNAETVDLATSEIQPIALDGDGLVAMTSGRPTGDLLSYSATPVLHGWVIAVWDRTGNTVWPQAVNLPAPPTLTAQAVGEWRGFPSVEKVGHLLNFCFNQSKDGKGAEPYSVNCELQEPPGVNTVFLPALGW